jgi:uncharacterized membrane protein
MTKETEEITKEEIKKEFQLERMILFSDAVFAIVITLMAIEIHLPELPHGVKYTNQTFLQALVHIYPTIFAYMLSFFFIGVMWYKHLQMFSLLKDYNKGVIVRNLIFLFFIGLFPFAASLIVGKHEIVLPAFIYFLIIILCLTAQLLLHKFILDSKEITIKTELKDQKADLKRRLYSLIAMLTVATLAYATYSIIPNAENKSYAIYWVFVFIPIIVWINRRGKTAK